MKIKQKLSDKIIEAIADSDEQGVTISQLKDRVDLERHTLAKYLYLMHRDGFVYYRSVGRAKLWFVQDKPVDTIFSEQGAKSYSERFLKKLVSSIPVGIIVTTSTLHVTYHNEYVEDVLGEIKGERLDNFLEVDDIQPLLKGLQNGQAPIEALTKDKQGSKLHLKINYIINPNKTISYIWVLTELEKEEMISSVKE